MVERNTQSHGSGAPASKSPDVRRILFVVEDVTLAQVVRLAALAERLDPRRFEVHFACREFPDLVFAELPATLWPLYTTDRDAAMRRLAKGERMYDEKTLLRYVDEELALFDRVQPDIVVGDFRLSLSVSAPLRKLPLATLINATWSPYAVRDGFPVPDHPIVSLIGPARAARYMPQALPKAFAYFAAPLSAVRRKHGLPPLDDLLEQLTYGDLTLYADVPEICPTVGAPPTHVYLGQVPWSPRVPLPSFWSELRDDIPCVYVTLGSSGKASVLPAVLEAVSTLPVQVILSNAGRTALEDLPKNVFHAQYIAGEQAVRRSLFAITNGGSATTYQALAEGVPVLGVPFNMDQYLTMSAVERLGAGLSVRAGSANGRDLRRAMTRLLESGEFRAPAERLREAFAAYDCFGRFAAALDEFFPGLDKRTTALNA